MKQKLWTKNFSLLTVSTVLGAVGGIAGDFALSFLVFDQTGSTLASALVIAVQFIPGFLVPLLVSPYLDRLPRKPFLVGGDFLNGVMFFLAGLYLLNMPFSYTGYLLFSLLLASLNTFDALAYNAIFPNLIPKGMEQKGYAISSTLYPFLTVLMMPTAAWLIDTIGVAKILMIQGGLSILGALLESNIRIEEHNRMSGEKFSLSLWKKDIQAALSFLKREKGLAYTYLYSNTSNCISEGCGPIMVAFFRTAPGFTMGMYAFFSVAECIGRSIGGFFHYHVKIPQKKKFGFAYFVYQFYNFMDVILLWLPYPLMLVNRAICGFLGTNSYSLRQAAIQSYLPDEYRARIIAFSDVMYFSMGAVLSVLIGLMGEFFSYPVCMSICGGVIMTVCFVCIWCKRKETRKIYQET